MKNIYLFNSSKNIYIYIKNYNKNYNFYLL